MSQRCICGVDSKGFNKEDAATATANISCWSDRDQQPNRGAEGCERGMVHLRSRAGIPACRGRRAEFPHVHQPVDRLWHGQAEGNRTDIWRADDHGEAIYEGLPGPRCRGILRGETYL